MRFDLPFMAALRREAYCGTTGGDDCARGRDFEKTAAMAEIAVVASNMRRLNRPRATWGDDKLISD